MRRSPLSAAVLATAMFALASCSDQPTSPSVVTEDAAGTASFARGGNKARATISSPIDVTDDGIRLLGTAYLTRIDLVDGEFMGTARIVGTATNIATGATEAVDQVLTTTLSINGVTGAGAASADAVSAQQIGVQQVGTCDVLDLVLGPLHLDLLGLVVDLNQVVLNIDAVAGAGNLVGNLLCTVLHLLDGPAIVVAILNILETINSILGNLTI